MNINHLQEPEPTTSSDETPKSPKKKSPVKRGGRKSKVEAPDESMEVSTVDDSESVEHSETREPEPVKEVKKRKERKVIPPEVKPTETVVEESTTTEDIVVNDKDVEETKNEALVGYELYLSNFLSLITGT